MTFTMYGGLQNCSFSIFSEHFSVTGIFGQIPLSVTMWKNWNTDSKNRSRSALQNLVVLELCAFGMVRVFDRVILRELESLLVLRTVISRDSDRRRHLIIMCPWVVLGWGWISFQGGGKKVVFFLWDLGNMCTFAADYGGTRVGSAVMQGYEQQWFKDGVRCLSAAWRFPPWALEAFDCHFFVKPNPLPFHRWQWIAAGGFFFYPNSFKLINIFNSFILI